MSKLSEEFMIGAFDKFFLEKTPEDIPNFSFHIYYDECVYKRKEHGWYCWFQSNDINKKIAFANSYPIEEIHVVDAIRFTQECSDYFKEVQDCFSGKPRKQSLRRIHDGGTFGEFIERIIKEKK